MYSKRRNKLAQPTVGKAVRAHDNLVLRKTMMARNKNVVAWDSQTVITELEEQGVDDVDEKKIVQTRSRWRKAPFFV